MAVTDDTSPMLSWHADLWAHMARAIACGRVAHGLLICGAPGVGKRMFARRLVGALLCRNRRPDGDACGACQACRQQAAGAHPDISRLMPEEPGRMIKVAQVRTFGHALHLTPQYEAGRVGWIDPAEQLSVSAANSLLKTLEEPPAGCHIVLLSDRVSALMATIRSRCQLWRVPPADPDAGGAWLRENGIDPRDMDHDILRTPLVAAAHHDAGYAELARGWDEDLARLLNQRANPVAVAERAVAGDPELWIDWACRRANALLAASLGAPTAHGLSAPLEAAARRIEPTVFRHWAEAVAASARLRHTNADWRLVLESVLLELAGELAPQGVA